MIGESKSVGSGPVLVMPRRTTEWATAAACWICAAGWAAAATTRFGDAWIVTPDAVVTADELLRLTDAASPVRHRSRRFIPITLRTAVKDLRRYRSARSFRDVSERSEWRSAELPFVWQYHDLFNRAGAQLARRHQCPLVSFVEAPRVWEDKEWKVRRPGWGAILERVGERPQLRDSDVVLCLSDEVTEQVIRLGVDERRILVSPTGVDARLFTPSVDGGAVGQQLGLGGKFVVGWTGRLSSNSWS